MNFLPQSPHNRLAVDVLIIGLGPAGGSAMLAAASKGLNVVAVERKSVIGKPVQCAEFIPVPISPYCTAPDIISQSVSGMITTLPSGAKANAAMQGLIINRACFDESLVTRSLAQGASYYMDSHLLSVNTSQRIALVKTPLGLQQIQYQFIIAADGPCSRVAKLMGLPALEVIKTQQYTVPLIKPLTDTYVWLSKALPGGYAWLFPKQDKAHVGVGAVGGCHLKYQLQRLHEQLTVQGFVSANVVARTGGKIPVSGIRSTLVKDRVLFVGDAAGLTHPITGAGIASAVASGDMAGNAVADALHSGDETPLMDYAEEVQELYGPAYSRALLKRRYLLQQLQQNIQREPQESLFRSSWIGFKSYYQCGGQPLMSSGGME